MKFENRTAPVNPGKAVRTEVRVLPDCLANLAAPRMAERQRAPVSKIEPSAFSREEMRQIVLEMIG